MTGREVDRLPAGAPPAALDFGEMLRRARVLADSKLVPKALAGNPEAIALVGAKGAELGVPFVTSLHEIFVIDNKPSPSAQLRLALVRRAGHEVRFPITNSERCVARGRRREYRGDPDAWTEVEWTIADAERAGLLDEWVERWANVDGRNRLSTFVLGRPGVDVPDWAAKLVAAGEVKRRENWHRYPAEMLRARAISALARLEFGDVLSGLGVDDYSPEERGVDDGSLDVEREVGNDAGFAPDDVIVDAEVVTAEVEHEERVAEVRDAMVGGGTIDDSIVEHAAEVEPEEDDGTPPKPLDVVDDRHDVDVAIEWDLDGWRSYAADHGAKEVAVLRRVREHADELGVERPLTLDGHRGDRRLVAYALDVIDGGS